jgi:plastocyanin
VVEGKERFMRERMAKVMAVSMVAVSLVLGGAGIASAGGGGCFHETGPSVGEGSKVEMVDFCFQATVLRVQPGAEVTWVNRDLESHTVTGVGGTWGSFDEVTGGERVSYSFKSNGIYLYACLLHPGMVGAVVVGDGRGDGGLDPATVATVLNGAGGGDATQETASTTSSGGLASGLAGGAVGILIGLGIAGALVARRRTVSRRTLRGGTEPVRSA